MYLNQNHGKNYDISEILNSIELDILKYTKEYVWGYQFPYYLSALNDCHPNYVKYLEKKNMLPVKDINEILQQIDESKKLTFNEAHAEELYQKHLQNSIDDEIVISRLAELLADKKVLLLGPGISIKTQQEKIRDYISKENPIVFSVNHVNSIFPSDYVFISNPKRYDQYHDGKMASKNTGELIITSNIKTTEQKADYVLSWDDLKSNKTIVGESSLYILIKALIKLKINRVVLAGFDGFSRYAKNYYDKTQQFYQAQENVSEVTAAIIEQIAEFQKYIKIDFLTDSAYKKEVALNA